MLQDVRCVCSVRNATPPSHLLPHPWPFLVSLCCCRFEGGLYDRVLLDAPCSSERHVVQAALEAGGVVSSSSWSKEHCSNLAALQLKVRHSSSVTGLPAQHNALLQLMSR